MNILGISNPSIGVYSQSIPKNQLAKQSPEINTLERQRNRGKAAYSVTSSHQKWWNACTSF
jgi:hypothetical protein